MHFEKLYRGMDYGVFMQKLVQADLTGEGCGYHANHQDGVCKTSTTIDPTIAAAYAFRHARETSKFIRPGVYDVIRPVEQTKANDKMAIYPIMLHYGTPIVIEIDIMNYIGSIEPGIEPHEFVIRGPISADDITIWAKDRDHINAKLVGKENLLPTA